MWQKERSTTKKQFLTTQIQKLRRPRSDTDPAWMKWTNLHQQMAEPTGHDLARLIKPEDIFGRDDKQLM